MQTRKAQSWSIDIVLAAIIFIAAFFVFYSLLNANTNAKAGNLKDEAYAVIKQVTNEETNLSVIEGNEVSVDKLNELKNLEYDVLKRRLRVDGDFCIYLEDSEGNVVAVDNSYKGIGSPAIILNGIPCS